MALLARDVLNPEPLEIDAGLDDVEERELAGRPLRAACGKGERALAFGRLVDDHEEFALVALGKDLPLLPRARLRGRLGLLRRDRLLLLCHRAMLPSVFDLRYRASRYLSAESQVRCSSGEVDGVALEVLEIDQFERRLMGRPKNDARGAARLKRLAPARGAQAPAVAGLEPREIEIGLRRRKIVATRLGEGEELGRHLDADRVQADILRPSVTAAGAENPGGRPLGPALERPAIDVPLLFSRLCPPLLHGRDSA